MASKEQVLSRAERCANFLKKTNTKFQKSYGANVLYRSSEVGNFKPLPTGFPNIDWINSGIGGLPRGGMTLIHGAESTGKTTLCLDSIRYALDQDPNCNGLFIDVENSLTESFLKFKKIDTSRVQVTPLNTEDALVIAENAIVDDIYDFIIVDSLAKLDSKAILDKDLGEKGQRNRRAAIITEFLRRTTFVLRKSNTALILINQEIDNQDPQPFAPKKVLPGGNQQKFSANLRLELKRRKTLKDGEKKIGYTCDVTSLKNKICGNEKAMSTMTYLYDRGFVREISLVEYLEDIGMVVALPRKVYKFKESNWYPDEFKIGHINKIVEHIKSSMGINLFDIKPSDNFVFKKNENAEEIASDVEDSTEKEPEELEELEIESGEDSE